MQLKDILLAKDALAYIETNYKENKVDVKITEQDLPKYYPGIMCLRLNWPAMKKRRLIFYKRIKRWS